MPCVKFLKGKSTTLECKTDLVNRILKLCEATIKRDCQICKEIEESIHHINEN